MEMTEKTFDQTKPVIAKEKQELVDFLYEHLDEYGDKKEHIARCIDYAMSSNPMAGGFVVEMREKDKIVGALVMNQTGMSGYIPENILVYIAVDSAYRGKGVGRRIMERSMKLAKGDVALHVEHDNPANFLYKNMGFENPYLEMRFYREGKPERTDN